MSASEKLKALLAETEQEWPDGQAGTECIDCFTPVPSVAKLLMPALPQIVAVVEAAERVDADHEADLPAAIGSAEAMHTALAALDQALSDG